MPMRKFCRITFGFAWNGFNTQFIDFSGWTAGDSTTRIAKFGKESKPERIIFVHIQYTWNTDRTAHGLLFDPMVYSERIVVCSCIQKGLEYSSCFFCSPRPRSQRLPVINCLSAGKTVDREKAVVGTALAACHGRFEIPSALISSMESMRAFLVRV